jgi:hypothetical protein
LGEAGIKTAEAQLGGDDHQSEEEGHGADVDRLPGLRRTEGSGGDEDQGAEQGHPGAIEGQLREPASEHPEIDDDKDQKDQSGHAGILHKVAGASTGELRAALPPLKQYGGYLSP